MFDLLHNFTPDPILLTLGPLTIHWYGLFIVLGIAAALALTVRLAKPRGIDAATVMDAAFWLVIGGIIGARLYHVVLELPYYLSDPAAIFALWRGGLAIHGAIIGGALALSLFTRRRRLDTITFAALLTPGLALAQAIGRLGNFMNQELYGRPTALPWGIPIDPPHRLSGFEDFTYFHPAFLYEMLGNLAIAAILTIVIKRTKMLERQALPILILYFTLYSLLRFGTEFIRIDPAYDILGLRLPQVVSLLVIALCALIYAYYRHTRSPLPK